MTYSIEVKHVPGQPLAVVRRVARQAELARVVPEACGEVWNYVKTNQIEGAGRLVAVYLDSLMTIEIGAEVAGTFNGDGNVYPSTTPAGLVATTVHLGPYERLGEAHEAIHDWCANDHRTLAGPSWEIYGHWTDDPKQLRTDVVYLLKDDATPP